MLRPNWDEYWLEFAKVASSRSACFRNHVGAVIIKDKAIVSSGYNGAPQYQKNCQEIGFCYRERKGIKTGTNLEQCRAVGSHAESNAIALAAKNGASTNNSTIYVIGHDFICHQCKAQIANSGIIRVILLDRKNKKHEFIPSRDWIIHPIDKGDLMDRDF